MRRVWLAALFALSLIGCDGKIGLPGSTPAGGDPNDPNRPMNPGNPNNPTDPANPPAETPSVSPRFVRLTHSQWERSVRGLLRLTPDEPTYVENLRIDPNQGGFIFDNNALTLNVDGNLWSAYQRTATQLADDTVQNAARLDRIVPAEPANDEAARARAFIVAFGQRAHRRPLTTAEVDEYVAVYTAGRDLYPTLTPFQGGIRLTLEAFLQSPFFVYRVERSDTPVDGVIPLDGFEVAARLSYFLWNSMPDDALLAAAAAGTLSEPAQIRAQAERLLADPRAEDVVARFHDALLMVERYASVSPSPAFFPDAPANLADLLERENDLFVRAMFRDGHGWSHMLTTTETYVNADLATLYGLTGNFTDEFQLVSLDPAERKGIFTQLGFLVSNATSVNPDPIHRGVFLSKHIACNPLAAPPDDIPPLPAAEGRTNRETVEAHTEVPGTNCAFCHTTLINPFGWPFEGYDALGQVRAEDNGHPVDTTATVHIQDETFDVINALALADTLAESPAVHECYAEHWVEYALGRPLSDDDAGIVYTLNRLSREGGSIRGMLARLVESPAFLARSTEELP